MSKFYQSDFRTRMNAKTERRQLLALAFTLVASLAIGGRVDYLMLFAK